MLGYLSHDQQFARFGWRQQNTYDSAVYRTSLDFATVLVEVTAGAAVVTVRPVTRIATAAKSRCRGIVAAMGLRVATQAALRRRAGGFMISEHFWMLPRNLYGGPQGLGEGFRVSNRNM